MRRVGGARPALAPTVAPPPQGGGAPRGASGALPARLLPPAGRDGVGAERLPSERWGAHARAANTPDRVEVGSPRHRRQATRVAPVGPTVARQAGAPPDGGLDARAGPHPIRRPPPNA